MCDKLPQSGGTAGITGLQFSALVPGRANRARVKGGGQRPRESVRESSETTTKPKIKLYTSNKTANKWTFKKYDNYRYASKGEFLICGIKDIRYLAG